MIRKHSQGGLMGSKTIDHGLGTRDIFVAVYDGDFDLIPAHVKVISENAIEVAPGFWKWDNAGYFWEEHRGTWRVVILG